MTHHLLLSLLFLSLLSQALSNFTATLFFGDSTLDTGNNDFIPTRAKGNHYPYGLSFTNGTSTGRFSNGLLVPDLVTRALGIKPLSPPFLDPNLTDSDVKTGVNFASSGSGLDELTSDVSKSMPFPGQLKWFEEYVKRLNGIEGEEEAKRIVEGALVVISSGANDMVFNFYGSGKRRKEYNISEYQDFLLQNLEGYIKNIYEHGGRKFVVAGLPPLGCLPVQITAAHPIKRICADEQNSDCTVFNSKLQKFLPSLQQSLPQSKLLYLDLQGSMMDVITNPAKYGFGEANKGCCGTGLFEMGPFCNNLTPVCKNVSNFAFFDAIHPSEKFYRILSDYAMKLAPEFG